MRFFGNSGSFLVVIFGAFFGTLKQAPPNPGRLFCQFLYRSRLPRPMATKGTHTVLKEIHLIATAKNHLVIDVLEPP